MNQHILIKATIRYNSKFNYIELFYYNEHKELVSYCQEEGHNSCCYDYYLSTKPISNYPHLKEQAERLVKLYEDEATKVMVMKRLQIGVCSY